MRLQSNLNLEVQDFLSRPKLLVKPDRRIIAIVGLNVDDPDAPASREVAQVLDQRGRYTPPSMLCAHSEIIILPKHLIVMMTEVRGASNERFKRTFAWAPIYSSWREGFRSGLG